LSFGEIFSVVAIPGVIAMAALLIKQIAEPSMEVPYVPVRRAPSTQ
jgi:hypothetical protein